MGHFWNSSWFCGQLDGHAGDNFTRISAETCVVNFASCLPPLLFIITSTVILMCCGCCSVYRQNACVYLQRFPAHKFRWLLSMLFVFVCMCALAEGLFTDRLYYHHGSMTSSTQPQLYLPQAFALLAIICSLVYYHQCESWQAIRLLNVLLAYWILGCFVEVAKLRHYRQTDTADFGVARFDFAIFNVCAYFVLIVLEIRVQFLKHIPAKIEEPDDMRFYEKYVNLLSFSFFHWIRWLMGLGYERPLVVKDLGSLPSEHTSKCSYDNLKTIFKKETRRAASKNQDVSLWRVYVQSNAGIFLETLLTRFMATIVMYLVPFGLYSIVTQQMEKEQGLSTEILTPRYISTSEFINQKYVLCVVAFSLATFLNSFLSQVTEYEQGVAGAHLRSAMQALVYEKSLRIYNLAGGKLSIGEITNHMSTDTMNLLFLAEKAHDVWSIPLNILFILIIMYNFVGVSALLSIVTIIVLLPLQAIIINKSSKYQTEALEHSDKRLKCSNEMLQGIKLLKLYGWVEHFREKLESIRTEELRSVLNFNIQYGSTVILCFALPTILSVVIFGTYPYLYGEALTPNVTFTTLTLIGLLTDPLYRLPAALSCLVNAIVTTHRLTKFLTYGEVESDSRKQATGDGDEDKSGKCFDEKQKGRFSDRRRSQVSNWRQQWRSLTSASEDEETLRLLYMKSKSHVEVQEPLKLDKPDETAIKIFQGDFAWDIESKTPIIRNINVDVYIGQLIMVVGSVGSGKSSFLSAIIGEMTKLNGHVAVKSKCDGVAYTAQTAWIINATIKDNILFGSPYDPKRYRQVLDACALNVDIDILPAGDETEIGEKGINLSGGQKQRVSVARALYSDKDIVLLDDPLSALDVHVGGHLFKHGIMGMLVRNHRTVVLVTHQLQYLQHADKILVMREGVIAHQGTFEEITSDEPELLASWRQALVDISESEAEVSVSDSDNPDRRQTTRVTVTAGSVTGQTFVGGGKNKGQRSTVDIKAGKLVVAEELERGKVSNQVYFYLLKSMGWPLVIVWMIARILMEIATLGRFFWLGTWSEEGVIVNETLATIDEVGNTFYLTIYCVVCLASIITSIFYLLIAVAVMYYAAQRIHLDMVRNIFRSPLRFFDTTPVGRTLNRLSGDTNIIDTKLWVSLVHYLYHIVSLPALLIAISTIIPIFILGIIPVFIVYIIVDRYFLASSRELQRLYSVSMSPVYAHFSETLNGLSTVRAYRAQKRLFTELLERIDTNNTVYLYLIASYGWVGNALAVLAFAILTMGSLTVVILEESNESINSTSIALVISFAFMIPYILWAIVRYHANTEIQMNAIERAQHYSKLPNENREGRAPSSSWPDKGKIEMVNMHVRYASDLPSVLKAINLTIKPGEKIGVCGRTGSGKSSLALTLFRVIDTFQGRLMIDDVDISTIPLDTLRQRLSIIPQEPILFTGTLRQNLDPEKHRTDAELWDALEIAQLKPVVANLDLGLDYEVSEAGENFSVGQRQLFCLARAFLRNSRILIMDEATASIDYDTEKNLQDVVAYAFREKTVITIAHRVATILQSDRIVVLNEGRVVENDTPEKLLEDESSIFASLVQANK